MPPLATRLMAGLAIFKHAFDFSDEEACARWVRTSTSSISPVRSSSAELSLDRYSMTRWRQRMGEERIAALLQENLSVEVKSGAMKPQDVRRVIIDATVEPKNVMFPTDAKLMHRAGERLVGLDARWALICASPMCTSASRR